MKKILLTAILSTMTLSLATCQNRAIQNKKEGSYLYYGQPLIEDNSMLIDEAFNQSHRSLQHITNLSFNKEIATYNYSVEVPLKNEKHQLSFSFNYGSIKKQNIATQETGLGDALISYRPLLFGKNSQALVVPRISLVIPSGNAFKGLGAGGWGSEFALAISKRIIPSVVTHYNIGYRWIWQADYYAFSNDGRPVKSERDCTTKTFGMSAVWLLRPQINLLVEYVINATRNYQTTTWVNSTNSIINPGIRCAITSGKMQIVPGFGLPLNFTGNRFSGAGAIFYISIEHDY
jgi:hypothetical protein